MNAYFKFFLLVFFTCFWAGQGWSQYTLKFDTAQYQELNAGTKILGRENPKFGVRVELPLHDTVANKAHSIQLDNFKLFGHFVDSLHILTTEAGLVFELKNGLTAPLRNYRHPSGQTIPMREVDTRLAIDGTEGSRKITVQYDYELTEISRIVKLQYVMEEGSSNLAFHLDTLVFGYVSFVGSQFLRTSIDFWLEIYEYMESIGLADDLRDPNLTYADYWRYTPQSDGGPMSGLRYTFSPSDHCSNGVQDADETGVDCGGAECVPCHCFDGVMNNGETAVDCGGDYCHSCGDSFSDINVSCDVSQVPLVDSLPFTNGMKFKIWMGERIRIDGMKPNTAYRFNYNLSNSLGGRLVVVRSSDLMSFEPSRTQALFQFGVSTDIDGMIGTTDSTGSLSMIYIFELNDCSRTSSSSAVITVTELSNTSNGSAYLETPEICMVTFDSILQTDVVVYVDQTPTIEDDIVYTATGWWSNAFSNPDAVAFSERDTGERYFVIPQFTPSDGNLSFKYPRVYQLMFKNGTGARSKVSTPQRVIAIDGQAGNDDEKIHLAWSPYIGFDADKYLIYRQVDTFPSQLIDSVPFSNLWYVDEDVPCGEISYDVRLPKEGGCSSTRSGEKRNYKASRSKHVAILTQAAFRQCDTTTAISEQNTSRFELIPNPTNTSFKILSPDESALSLELFDQQGRRLLGRMNPREENIDVSHLSAGIYLVQLKLGDGRFESRKLIKY